MAAVESSLVLLPRPTTLIGATTFNTQPLDVSQFGSVQCQLWRGPIAGGGSPTILFYFEESLDAQTWALGPSTPEGYDPANNATGGDASFVRPQFFAYSFRLRWFRIRVVVTGSAPIVTCWAEGFLRDGGGGGAWAHPAAESQMTLPAAMGVGASAHLSSAGSFATGPEGMAQPGAQGEQPFVPFVRGDLPPASGGAVTPSGPPMKEQPGIGPH